MRQLGSVTEESEVSFEFTVRPEYLAAPQAAPADESPKAEAAEAAEEAAASSQPALPAMPDSLPFQLRIHYTKPNGTKYLRVVTNAKPVTQDRTVAEKVCVRIDTLCSDGSSLSHRF
jgi:hypothetical protein